MTEVLSGSTQMPLALMTWPRNLIVHFPNSHFRGFSVTPTASRHSNVAVRRVSCSSWFDPNSMTLSIKQRTPGSPSSNCPICLGNNSGALVILKGNLLYQPKGVINVVRCRDSSANGFCQNPLFMSSLLMLPRVVPRSCLL